MLHVSFCIGITPQHDDRSIHKNVVA